MPPEPVQPGDFVIETVLLVIRLVGFKGRACELVETRPMLLLL